MIAPLRARQLRLVATVCLLAAVGSVAALAVRRAPSTVAALPEALRAAGTAGTAGAGQFLFESAELWDAGALRTTVRRLDGRLQLDLAPVPAAPRGPGAPDVLLYASAGPVPAPAPNARLPGDAVLLGPFPGDPPRAFQLPPSLADGGWLVLYSLARHEVVDRALLPPPAAAVRVEDR
jgi:hypothetical protein